MELITENLILLDQDIDDKTSLIYMLADSLLKEKRIENVNDFLFDVEQREQIASTAIGDEIAIPHAISAVVKSASLVFIRLRNDIYWNSEDKVKYIFGIAVPIENKNNQHLQILSSLARKMLDEEFKKRILYATTREECVSLLNKLSK